MSDKALVLEAIQKLPDDATISDIRERLEFISAVKRGLEQVQRGETVPLDAVEKKIERWASR